MVSRTAFIIDGFNVYHSLIDASKNLGLPGETGTKWLNLRGLCESYIPLFALTRRSRAHITSPRWQTTSSNHTLVWRRVTSITPSTVPRKSVSTHLRLEPNGRGARRAPADRAELGARCAPLPNRRTPISRELYRGSARNRSGGRAWAIQKEVAHVPSLDGEVSAPRGERNRRCVGR